MWSAFEFMGLGIFPTSLYPGTWQSALPWKAPLNHLLTVLVNRNEQLKGLGLAVYSEKLRLGGTRKILLNVLKISTS